MKTDYSKQRINSERSLQAALWSSLNARLPDHQRMFIEPRFRTRDSDTRCIPDFVICGKRRIIAVIEIKYRPRDIARYKKDLRTLDTLARERTGLSVSNTRFAGLVADKTKYTFSTSTLFIWAGFHLPHATGTYESLPLFSTGYDALTGCFMQLHAETSFTGPPGVFHRVS